MQSCNLQDYWYCCFDEVLEHDYLDSRSIKNPIQQNRLILLYTLLLMMHYLYMYLLALGLNFFSMLNVHYQGYNVSKSRSYVKYTVCNFNNNWYKELEQNISKINK